MIKLHGFGQYFGVVDASPFVIKVDLFLRMVKLPYETVVSSKNLGKSPKGKLPFINDEGEIVADSAFILRYLTEKYQLEIDDFLTPEQRAQTVLFTQALDDNFYWGVVYSRWSDDKTWPIAKQAFFGKFPLIFRILLPGLIRKKVIKNLYGQGTGRHTHREILAIMDNTLAALSTLLSDNNYFFGEQVASFDAIAYSHLCELISVNYDSDVNQLAKKYDNLVAYCQRIEKAYY